MNKQTFEVTVKSPHGKQAIEAFRHFLSKVADDARERWGIKIQITRVEDSELPENGGFDR